MRIDQILARLDRPVFSFEFFPPKTDDGFANLRTTLDALRNDEPDFVSVTYGALGTTRDRTLDIVKWIKQDLDIEAMAHFTCVGATREELSQTLTEMAESGVDNVLALRGDPPQGETEWKPTEGGLLYSTELIELLQSEFEFAVGAAAFPEVHPEAESAQVRPGVPEGQAGRRRQLLHHPAVLRQRVLLRLRGEGPRHGHHRADHPGHHARDQRAQHQAHHRAVQVRDPEAFERELDRREDDTEAVEDLGVAYSTLQCVDLLSRGAPGHPLLHAEPLARDARHPGRAARRQAVDAGLAAGLS